MLGTSINLVALSFFIGWWDGNAKDEKNQLYDSLLFFLSIIVWLLGLLDI